MYSDRHRLNGYSSAPDTHTRKNKNGRSKRQESACDHKKLIVRGKLYGIGYASTPIELLRLNKLMSHQLQIMVWRPWYVDDGSYLCTDCVWIRLRQKNLKVCSQGRDQDSASAWKGARAHLRTLEVRLGLGLGMQGTSVQHAPDVQCKTKIASPPTFSMLIMIHIYLFKATTSDVMTNIAGGFLFNAYAWMWGEQSGNCSFSFVAPLKKEGRFKGTVWYGFSWEKPQTQDAVPRPFWLCLPGIQGGREWHRKNPSQLICWTRLPLTACKALDNVFHHRIPTCALICCTNVTYVV